MVSHLILVLGQSNAMNFGTVGLPFPGGWTSDAGIQIWNGFRASPGFETYNPGVNSGGMDSASGNWGPEAEYARQWRLKYPGVTLYIYKQALGGTGDGVAPKGAGILDWNPASSPSDSFKQFPRMVTGVIAAANYLGTLGQGSPSIDTIIYAGCETDTVLQADADACLANLQSVITSIRGLFNRPDARCVLSRPFPNNTQGPYLNTVRAAVVALGRQPNNAWFSLDGLTESVPHPGHLDPPSVVTMGLRAFTADQALIPPVVAVSPTIQSTGNTSLPTNTELVNAALRKGGGAKRILDLTDAVGSAGIAADVLASERDDLLRDGVWNFTVTRIQLAQLATLPPFGFAFAYAMPSDNIRVVSVHDNDAGTGAVRYKIEALMQADGSYINVIASDSNAIFLRYCRAVADPNLMTASFRQVLILRMAKIFAISIAKSNALFAALEKEEETALRRAKSEDGVEDYPDALPEGSWADSRRSRGRQADWFNR